MKRKMVKIKLIANEVIAELERATEKFGSFKSSHEGYCVLLEEVDELWDEVKANRGRTADARSEAIQIAAMAIRYVLDISDH